MIVQAIKLTEAVHKGADFSGASFRTLDLSHSIFHNCCFDRADLTEANCEGSDFTGSSFRKSLCTRTNFRNAKLAATVFEPDDCYGMTLTLDCKTFENMRIGQLWWFGWLLFGTMMTPAPLPDKSNLTEQLIAVIGSRRYVKLRDLFRRREL